MKKTLLVMTALLLAGVASASLPEAVQQKAWRNAKKSVNQKVIAARPEIKSAKLIVSGNKKLSLEADGTITLSNSSRCCSLNREGYNFSKACV